MRLALIAYCLSILLGCAASKTTSDEPQTVQMKAHAVRDIEEATKREDLVEQHPLPPQEQTPDEELAVEMFELTAERPVRSEDGLEIRLRSPGPSWVFDFDHHGRKTTASVQGKSLYLEGTAFGHLYVFSQFGDAIQVTLRSDAPAQPLAAEHAFGIARRESHDAGEEPSHAGDGKRSPW